MSGSYTASLLLLLHRCVVGQLYLAQYADNMESPVIKLYFSVNTHILLETNYPWA
jgi:hypothetical protein